MFNSWKVGKLWANDKIKKSAQFLESLVVSSDLDWIKTSFKYPSVYNCYGMSKNLR